MTRDLLTIPARFNGPPGTANGGYPFPTCFVCGPLRPDDGMRIFPGPAGHDGMLACPWRPTADLAANGVIDPRFVWAALDCPRNAGQPRAHAAPRATAARSRHGR